jgi:hypothetical protein
MYLHIMTADDRVRGINLMEYSGYELFEEQKELKLYFRFFDENRLVRKEDTIKLSDEGVQMVFAQILGDDVEAPTETNEPQ